jgi:flagellin
MREEGLVVTQDNDGSLKLSGGVTAVAISASEMTGVTATVNAADPSTALTAINTALNNAKSRVAQLGTDLNRLAAQGDFIKSLTDSLSSGLGTLVDADLAEESAKLQALQTKQQLGMQALSIANQQPGSVLSLFR